MPRDEGLTEIAPQPIVDERTPLLSEPNDSAQKPPERHRRESVPAEAASLDASLQALAERERAEHEAGATPVAEEPTTGRLLMTMGSLWLSTFFAALGTSSPKLFCADYSFYAFWRRWWVLT